jgi:chromosome segregation ATPase
MAISSIHIEKGKLGYCYHNTRQRATKNSIFPENKVEYDNSAEDAIKIFRDELKKREIAYTKRTGQKLQKNLTKHLSAIVNLQKHHTLEDVKKVAEYLEKELNTKVFQIAIHRDEGWIDENGVKHVNYHGHLEFLGLDSEGRSVRKKLDRKFLIQLQDKVAEILKMKRGINYAKTKKPRPKRLDTYEYKKYAKDLYQQKITVKELKQEISKLRKEMIEANQKTDLEKLFSKKWYDELSKIRKELNAKNVKEVYVKFLDFKNKVEEEKLKVAEKLDFKQNELKILFKKLHKKREKANILENKLKNKEITVKELKSEISELREMIIEVNKDLTEKLFSKEDYNRLSQIKQKIKTADPDLDEVYADFYIFKTEIKQKIEKLKEKSENLEKKEKENDEMSEIIFNLSLENKKLKKEIKKLKEENKNPPAEEKKEEIKKQKEKAIKLECVFEPFRLKLLNLQKEYNDLQTEYNNLQTKYNDLEDKYNDLKDENETLKKEKSDLESKISTLESEKQNLNSKIAELNKKPSKDVKNVFEPMYEIKLQKLEKEVEDLKDKNNDLKKENEELKKENNDLKSYFEKQKDWIKEMFGVTISATDTVYQTIVKIVDSVRNSIQDNIKKIEELQDKIKDKDDKIQRLEEEVQLKDDRISELEKEVEELNYQDMQYNSGFKF